VAQASEGVVVISPAYLPTLARWGVPEARTRTIPNWGLLDEMPLTPRDNPWARTHGLVGRKVALYSGTLGLKHDPGILLRMAQQLRRTEPEARLVVVSEGQGRDWLQRSADGCLPQLVLVDYQPYSILPEVLGSADLVLALLEPGAGEFSVPSKILNYLCAGKPILAVVPPENMAGEMITRASAGWVVSAREPELAPACLLEALGNEAQLARFSRNAREFAEVEFGIERIGQQFEEILLKAGRNKRDPHPATHLDEIRGSGQCRPPWTL
jgi:colanic acid biosynthesis glycosyl transferase WcaI